MAKNKVLEEMLAKAKATATSSAGTYMKTIASNVYKSDGSTIEPKAGDDTSDVPAEDPTKPLDPEPVEDPTDTADNETITETLSNAEDNAVIKIAEGSEISTTVTIAKSVTTQGDNAGIAQNFKQEV